MKEILSYWWVLLIAAFVCIDTETKVRAEDKGYKKCLAEMEEQVKQIEKLKEKYDE